MAERFTAREALVYQAFVRTGALRLGGHYVYTSDRHGSDYINKADLYAHSLTTEGLCAMMADDFRHHQIDTVVGPAQGAIILASNTASALSQISGEIVFGVSADKIPGSKEKEFHFTQGRERFIKGKRILLVEDNLTTGGSLKMVYRACIEAGAAEVVGAAALVNRGGVKPEDAGVKLLRTLLNIDMDSWAEDACQLCADGVPVNTVVGKGAEFLRRRAALL